MEPTLNNATRLGLNCLALLAGVAVLWLGKPLIIPLVIATLFASILWPSTLRLNSFYRLPWPLACIIAVGSFLLLNALVIAAFALAVPRLLQSVPNPNNESAQIAAYDNLRAQAGKFNPALLDAEYLPEKATDSQLFLSAREALTGGYIVRTLYEVGKYSMEYLWQFILIVFILIFMLMEGKMLTRRVVEVFGPSGAVQGQVTAALLEMARVVRAFLVYRTLINIGIGVVVGVVYQFLGLRQAWTWALLTAVLCYIPYIGPIIAGVPPLVDALLAGPAAPIAAPWSLLVILVFYTGVITLEGYVIVPMLMGRHLDLNATTVMLACLFWELVWGTPGLFLAMPLMAAIKAICDHVPGWKPWANLMSAHLPEEMPVPPTPVPRFDPDQTIIMHKAL